MKTERLTRLLGLCGILFPIFSIIILILSVQMTPWFNLTEYAISDLGLTVGAGSFFNYGIIIAGFLLLIFSLGLILDLKNRQAGPTILLLSSLFLIGVGVFPLPNPNHIYVSSLFFIGFSLSFLILGINMIKSKTIFIKKMGRSALICVVIAGVSPVFLLFVNGIAITELFSIFPGFIWCMRYGFYFLTGR
jgi:hypothetical membrane protein